MKWLENIILLLILMIKITKSSSISMNNESKCIPEESRCRKPLNLEHLQTLAIV